MLGVRARLHALEQQHPEWRSWLVLCEETLRALDDDIWHTMDMRPRADQPPHVPLLDGLALIVDGGAVRRWIDHLNRRTMTSLTGGDSRFAGDIRQIDACVLLVAAARQDLAWLQAQADSMNVDRRALQALAQLAVVPLLQECRRRLADRRSVPWTQGYCPFCGAWPVVAEVRGVERTRHLRCGRCGGEWHTDWLRCPFCGETAHERLAFLILEEKEETHSIATCSGCQGYIKTLTTLQGAAPQSVMLDDLATVELDVVALGRGYVRPVRPGYCVDLNITERTRSWSSLLRRSR